MSEGRRRALLYGVGLALAGALVFVGFGITVPPDPGTRLNGATLIAGMGDYDQALEICDVVLREHPDSLDARVFKATFLAMAERDDEALLAYGDALAHATDTEVQRDLLLDRAALLLNMGRFDEFRREKERLARHGVDHRVHMLEGLAAEQAGEWARAVAAYADALARKEDDQHVKGRLWNALVSQGDAAVASGRLEAARAAYDRARPLFESASQAHLKAIEVRLALETPRDALSVCGEVGLETPGIAPLMFRAATGVLEDGDLETALLGLKGACEADPEGTRALFQKETAWDAHRDSARVRRILESRQNATSGELPGRKRVIDTQGTAPIEGSHPIRDGERRPG